MPPTVNGRQALAVLSAMQKFIRRGMEREAMLAACELGHTSKSYFTMLCNRLEIISHEDIGLANPALLVLVATCVEQATRTYDTKKPGRWRMILGNAIRAMCRSAKSREADHYQAAIGLPNQWGELVPEIPDFALDHHTIRGRQMGRGLDHFRKESTKLVPAPKVHDAYEDEAYECWKRKHEFEAGGGEPSGGGRLF